MLGANVHNLKFKMKKLSFLAMCVMASLFVGCEQEQSSLEVGKNQAYVDLGLSVKWAKCNIGARRPVDEGSYFAWGEVNAKETYTWANYKWCKGTPETLTKYCTHTEYGILDTIRDKKGKLDTVLVLRPEDDAATANWGEQWRMPTQEEMQELLDSCNWEPWTKFGVFGFSITAKNEIYKDTLFLPFAGVMITDSTTYLDVNSYYWSSTLLKSSPRNAYSLSYTAYQTGELSVKPWDRCNGRSIRPVCSR